MIKINLIPPEYIERINRKTVIAKAVLAGVLVAAVITLASLWQFTREKTIGFTLQKRETELAVLQKDVDQVKAIEAQIAEVQRYLNAVEAGQAQGWHTLVYGLTLAVYSLPARQGLLHYARQTLFGFIYAAARPLQLGEADCRLLLEELCAALPKELASLLAEPYLKGQG